MTDIIKIGIGFGSIKFGTKKDEVASYFGEPEKISKNGESPNKVIAWHYWDRDYSIYFDENKKYVFSSMTIQDQNVELFGKKIFRLSIDEIKELFLENGFNEFCEEKGDDGSVDLTILDAACIAFFEKNGALSSFDWFTFTDDDTDKTIWPE